MLNHLYGGNLLNPSSNVKSSLNGHLLLFDQESFINGDFDDLSLREWIVKSLYLYQSSNWNGSNSSIFNVTLTSEDSSFDDDEENNLPLGFAKEGFVYIPWSCSNGKKCSIHIALHGCEQGWNLHENN